MVACALDQEEINSLSGLANEVAQHCRFVCSVETNGRSLSSSAFWPYGRAMSNEPWLHIVKLLSFRWVESFLAGDLMPVTNVAAHCTRCNAGVGPQSDQACSCDVSRVLDAEAALLQNVEQAWSIPYSCKLLFCS